MSKRNGELSISEEYIIQEEIERVLKPIEDKYNISIDYLYSVNL